MRIAVIGAGKMGVWFAKFFQSQGYMVTLADRKKEKLDKLKYLKVDLTADFKEAVQNADQVLIGVSIGAFKEVVKTLSPALHKGQIIMDICSIKQAPVDIMHQNIKDATVLGTHPVFGPGSNGLKHKAYILTPTNPNEQEFAEQFKKWLETQEAHVFIMTPKKHDELMSTVLGLPHFLGLVACETLLEQKNLPLTKQVAGTTYRMLFTLAEATMMETPDLYAAVQINLSDLIEIEGLFIAKAEELLTLIKNKDPKAIAEHLEQVKKRLAKADSDFAQSYSDMYKMLESTEK